VRGIAYQGDQPVPYGDINAFLDSTNVDIHQPAIANHQVSRFAAHSRRHHVQSDFMESPPLVGVSDGLIGARRR
jgi:hypothetical protein